MADGTSSHIHTSHGKHGTSNLQPIDRWHSRPLDVHRWSDHLEVQRIVKQIYDALPKATLSEITSKSNNKAKASGETHLRVLILDLYVAWMTDPTLAIGVSMGNGDYKVNSRYNALFISPKIRPLVHALNTLGYIDHVNQSYSTTVRSKNSTTRIRASEKLAKMFRSAKMSIYQVDMNTNKECIVLKNADEATDGYKFSKTGVATKIRAKEVEYHETTEIRAMRSALTKYNELLKQSFVDLPILEEPFILRNVDGKDQEIRIGGYSAVDHGR